MGALIKFIIIIIIYYTPCETTKETKHINKRLVRIIIDPDKKYNLLKLTSRLLFSLFESDLSTRKALLYGLSIICVCISYLYFLRRYNKSSVQFFFSSHHLHVSFLSRVKVNSTNWPAPNVWVFIAEVVEHCSTNAEAMGSNPVEDPKICFGYFCKDLKS